MKQLLRTCVRMSGKLLSMLALATLNYESDAQVSTYIFAQSSGTFNAITGGTLIVANTDPDPAGNDSASMDDYLYANRSLPFPFTFNGTSYTTYNICSNGWISFGTGTSLAGGIIAETDYSGAIAGFGYDLMGPGGSYATITNNSNVLTDVENTTTCQVGAKIYGPDIPAGTTVTAVTANTITMSAAATGTTDDYISWTSGDIRTDVIGTAPNRTFVVQFRNMSTYGPDLFGGANEGITFQIRLTEGGGVAANQSVSVVYGNNFCDNFFSFYEVQVGLRGLTPSDFNNREGSSWPATTAGTDEFAVVGFEPGAVPPSGLTFTWIVPVQCTGTPAGGTVSSSVAAACPNAPFTLSTTGTTVGLGLAYQWQSSPAGAGTFTNISGATAMTHTVTGQTAATDYRLVVTCTNGTVVNSANSDTVTVNQNAAVDCPCIPSYVFSCGDGDDIDTFTLTGEQSTAFNDLATGCSLDGYDDRTGQTPVKLEAGGTYSGTISSNYGDDAVIDGTSERARFWIDFNDNGVFEAADSVGVKDTVLTSAVSYSITLPATATPGIHRMRVRLAYDTPVEDLDPCLELDFGETHDYKIEVLCMPPAVALGNDTAICDGATLNLNAGNPGATYDWSTGGSTQSIGVTAAGTYSVEVTTAPGCTASDTIVVSIAPLPTAGTVSATGTSPTFNFSTTGAANADTYSWNFGDGSSPAGGAQAGHTYTANGTYTVTLTVTNECGTATATTTVTVSGISVGMVPVSADELKLYPNPSSGLVTISNVSALKMQSLTVTNAIGAVVLQKNNLDTTKDTIDVGHLAAGVYTVRIRTDKGVVVRQLQVMRQ